MDFLSRLAPKDIPQSEENDLMTQKIYDVALINRDRVDLREGTDYETDYEMLLNPSIDGLHNL